MTHKPEQTLVEWLKTNEVKQIDFARLIEVHRSAVTYYVQGKRRPISEIAKRIEHATNGNVPASIWQVAA